jgi:mannitol-1-/sugar-/sorbitol-6-/2-deoxyglucose-6-phosphatase
MEYKAVIFDMDGLLIDSEPLWQEAGRETLASFGHTLSMDQYHSSTGLRTEEWIEHWFHFFGISMEEAPVAVKTIVAKAIEKIDQRGELLPGAAETIQLFREQNYRIGLATSSPMELVEVVLPKIKTSKAFDTVSSAGELPFGKPHPQVYINCAASLGTSPVQCIAFEDSFNGFIAAKAARMKCIVVPSPGDFEARKWDAADLKLRSLTDFSFNQLKLF